MGTLMDRHMLWQWLFVALVFASVVVGVFAIQRSYVRRREQSRLRQLIGEVQSPAAATALQRSSKASRWVDSLYRLSLPSEGWSEEEGRIKFLRAGFRSDQAPRIHLALKTALVIVLPLLVLLVLTFADVHWDSQRRLMVALLAAAVAYYGPDLYLHWRTRSRQLQMQQGLPDLVDLMVVALEAGMGLDQAMTRVARELVRSHPTLSEEFYLAGLEVRAGVARAAAMKNLAQRVNLEDLSALITMINQSERFGTSLGESLRIQSEVMRMRRGQRAEEIAAKIPIKMLFPLIFCIFPSIMVVLVGPGWMRITEAFRFA